MAESNDDAQSESNEENPSFEEAFTRLEEVVRRLEGGQLTLDEATKLFEKGMMLAKVCNERLSSAELKISRLQKNFAEQLDLVSEE